MSKKKQQYSGNFKLKIALKFISNDVTMNELSQQYGLHKSVINRWVKQVKDSGHMIFEKASDNNKSIKSHEKELGELHSKIGELLVERDF